MPCAGSSRPPEPSTGSPAREPRPRLFLARELAVELQVLGLAQELGPARSAWDPEPREVLADEQRGRMALRLADRARASRDLADARGEVRMPRAEDGERVLELLGPHQADPARATQA